MKKSTWQAMRELAYYSSLGLQVALSIFIGLGVGVWLDQRVLNSSPWATLIGLALGIAAAYRNIGLAITRSRRL